MELMIFGDSTPKLDKTQRFGLLKFSHHQIYNASIVNHQ